MFVVICFLFYSGSIIMYVWETNGITSYALLAKTEDSQFARVICLLEKLSSLSVMPLTSNHNDKGWLVWQKFYIVLFFFIRLILFIGSMVFRMR